MSIHLIVSESEQLALVNALSFYNAFYTFPSDELDKDEQEQWLLCFKEDNGGLDREGPVDVLATKIANSH